MLPRDGPPERERICSHGHYLCLRDGVIDLGQNVGIITRCFANAMEYVEFQMRCHVLVQLDTRQRVLDAMSQWAARQQHHHSSQMSK